MKFGFYVNIFLYLYSLKVYFAGVKREVGSLPKSNYKIVSYYSSRIELLTLPYDLLISGNNN